jgi:hypothetical protein
VNGKPPTDADATYDVIAPSLRGFPSIFYVASRNESYVQRCISGWPQIDIVNSDRLVVFKSVVAITEQASADEPAIAPTVAHAAVIGSGLGPETTQAVGWTR